MIDMTDFVALSKHHTSEAAAKQLRRRRFAEWRLKAYGVLAIFLSGLALVTLLWTVIGNATGVVREHYVTLPVALPADEIDPDNMIAADFGGIAKTALRSHFPHVTGRKEKRALNDVISSGAAFELREEVVKDNSLIGQRIEYRFLASDVTDLYLKGEYGAMDLQPSLGALEIQEADEKGYVFGGDPQLFAPALPLIQAELLKRAARLDQLAMQEANGVRVFEERLLEATEETRAEIEGQITARRAKMEKAIADAQAFRAAATQDRYVGEMDEFFPSLFIKAKGGWAKITEITETGGKAAFVKPVEVTGALAEGDYQFFMNARGEVTRKIKDNHVIWVEDLRADGRIDSNFNWRFFTAGDSREPEQAGIWGALVGSALTMLVTFFLAFPVGVLSAIYLEEFAPRNRLTDFVEVNINNLAAVPSIVFGLLGLSVFLGVFGVPRSAPLAGGIVLALMSLPTIIIASRAAIRAVPPSIRDAALGLGASRLQTSFHHVLPLAMPGILTGSIIAMAQALGETAPLIMIGMVAFIVDIPDGIFDSASVLPVQVFRWADLPERAFEARTAAAIVVLLVFLVLMNALAVFLRKRFERRW
ncbi:MAG: phosphate ABC transporter permease PstA [Pseudomonadota bacterium]